MKSGSVLRFTQYWAVTEEKVWRNEFPVDADRHNWLKFGFQFETEDVRDALLKALEEHGGFEISNSHPFNLEVNTLGINLTFLTWNWLWYGYDGGRSDCCRCDSSA